MALLESGVPIFCGMPEEEKIVKYVDFANTRKWEAGGHQAGKFFCFI